MNTQNQIVKDKLEKDGEITNKWAYDNNIWRLGARIHELRLEGMYIETIYKNEKGMRNTRYILNR